MVPPIIFKCSVEISKMAQLKLFIIMSFISFGWLKFGAESFMSFGWILSVILGCVLAGVSLVLKSDEQSS